MAEMIRVNKKVINDPLYTPVNKFLQNRIVELEADGNKEEELALAKERYNGLIAGDLVIENPVRFQDGITRVCFVSRKTGFARVDVDIKRVPVEDIVEDFGLTIVEVEDIEALKTLVKTNDKEAVLLKLKWKNTYGVLLTQDAAKTINGPMAAFGELFFENYTTERESLTSIDYETLESGVVKISDASCHDSTYPLFIQELVLEETKLPEITSNLPTEITTRRGKTFEIPNTFWFNGTEDITLTADVRLTTGSGYTIPKRSDDLLKIEGETIFGSATEPTEDKIIVRVMHMYNGRPVYKTFTIKVVIEIDDTGDLTFLIDPETLTIMNGGDAEVHITPLYKGEKFEILIPPLELVSKNHWTTLKYDHTTADGALVYMGKGNAPIGPDETEKRDICSQEFEHDGVTATAYVNIIMVKPDTLPQLEIEAFTGTARGYINDTGVVDLVVSFKGQKLDNKDLNIKTGVQGQQGLINITEVMSEGLAFKLIKDSGKPGEPISETVPISLRYRGPDRITYTKVLNLNVVVDRLSEIKIEIVGDQPIATGKYDYTSFPVKVTLNGKNATADMNNLNIVDQKNYLVLEDTNNKRVQCLGTGKTDETIKVKFVWTQMYDGINHQHEQEVQYLVKAWTGGTVVIIPQSHEMTGRSDENGSVAFKVYDDRTDITATAVLMADRTTMPEHVTMISTNYNVNTGYRTLSYRKDDPSQGTGVLCFRRATDNNPAETNIGKMTLKANITQSRILKLVEVTKDSELTIDEVIKPTVRLSFAGQEISLLDPNLTHELPQQVTDIRLTKYYDSAVDLTNTMYRYDDRTVSDGITIRFTYKDTEDNQNKVLDVRIPVSVIYPKIIMTTGTAPLDVKIWDKGTVPITLRGGNRDFTSKVYQTEQIQRNKYINTSRLSYDVVYAEDTPTTTVLPLLVRYQLDGGNQYVQDTEVVFNIAAWDGITFEIYPDPTSVAVNSGDTGYIDFTCVHKGVESTTGMTLDSGSYPIFFVVGTPALFQKPDGSTVYRVPYTTKKGGKAPVSFQFSVVNPVSNEHATGTTSVAFDVKWPDDLNEEDLGGGDDKDNPGPIKGYHTDVVEYPIKLNFAGVPVDLRSSNVTVSYESTPADAAVLQEVKESSITILLAKGGDMGKDYDYPSNLTITYTDDEGKVFTLNPKPKTTIRIPNVTVTNNPNHNVHVYDHAPVDFKLTDERGKDIPVLAFRPTATNPYVKLTPENEWYIQTGSQTTDINTELPLDVDFNIGGKQNTLKTKLTFTIVKWDNISFTAKANTEKLEGVTGASGLIQFTFMYKGFQVNEGVRVDFDQSIIPPNVGFSELDIDGTMTYFLQGNGNDNAKLVFIYDKDPTTPPVQGVNLDKVLLTVSSTSGSEQFEVKSIESEVTGNWDERVLLKVKLRYGAYDIPANSPGVKYTLSEAGDQRVTITGATKEGVTLRLIGSDGPNTTLISNEILNIEYNVGIPDPNGPSHPVKATIKTGAPEIKANDTVEVKVWDKRTLPQYVTINDARVSSIVKFEVRGESPYIEMTGDRAYEVIGATAVKEDHTVPMTVTYKVDEKEYTLDFDAVFNIAAHTAARFYVVQTPANISVVKDQEVTVAFRPVYKDKDVGGAASFKQDLSTLPKNVSITNVVVSGTSYMITFKGLEGGTGNAELVFWSPDAGTAPKDRDVAKVKSPVLVTGDFGLEVGARDNLLVASHNSTGNYKLEILNGGYPIDIKAEITAGRLTIAKDGVTQAPESAQVLTTPNWYADSFDWKAAGLVSPGVTTNCSEFYVFTYKVGAQTSQIRVEIPMAYTNNPATITGVTPITTKMFAKGTWNPTITCDGVNISSEFTLAREKPGSNNGYVKLTLKQWEIVNADVTASVKTVPTQFIGKHRVWDWVIDVDCVFNIAAWNQKTFEPIFPAGWSGNFGTAHPTLGLNVSVRGGTIPVQPGFDYLDPDLTDLKGLFELDYVNSTYNTTNYTLTPKKLVKQSVRLGWRNYGSAMPGVENVDYGYTDFLYDLVQRAMSAGPATAALAGGNGDLITLAHTVTVTGISTMGPNDPSLTIKLDNEDFIKISQLTATGIVFEVTAPLTKVTGSDVVNLRYKWVNPSNPEDVAEFVKAVTINYRQPLDYPVCDSVPPFKANNKPYKDSHPYLYWKRGDWFKVTVRDQTGAEVNIMDQCELVRVSAGWCDISKDYPTVGIDFLQARGPGNSSGNQPQTFYFRAPFRGDFVEVSSWVNVETSSGYPNGANPFVVTGPISAGLAEVGKVYELPFNVSNQGVAIQGYFRPEYSQVSTSKWTDFFEFISQRYDAASGITYVTCKMLKTTSLNSGFVFTKLPTGPQGVAGTDYALTPVGFSNVVFTPVASRAPIVFYQTRNQNTLFTISVNGTDITTSAVLLSVDDPLARISIPGNGQGQMAQVVWESDGAVPAGTRTVTYTYRLPAAYNNVVVTYTDSIPNNEWDGVHYKTANVTTGVLVQPITIQQGTSFNVYFHGASVNPSTQTQVSKAKFETLNPKLTFVSQSLGGANWFAINWIAKEPFVGEVIIPLDYIGPGHDAWPAGTMDKNYTEARLQTAIYEEELYIYPDDIQPAEVTCKFGDVLDIPLMLSMGKNVLANKLLPNDGRLSYVINGGNGVISKATPDRNSTSVRVKVDYDNRGTEDAVIQIPTTWTFNGTMNNNGRALVKTKVVTLSLRIKGTGTGDIIEARNVTSPTAKTWTYVQLPFNIYKNDVQVSPAAYKEITVDANPYVRSIPTAPPQNTLYLRSCEVYNGEKSGPTKTDVTFHVTWNDGVKDVTFTFTTPITVSEYDGNELVALFRTGSGTGDKLMKFGASVGSNPQTNISAKLRGAVIQTSELGTNGKYGVWSERATIPGLSASPRSQTPTGSGVDQYLDVRWNTPGPDYSDLRDGYIVFGDLSKQNDPTAVEGLDFVKMPTQTTVWITNKIYPSATVNPVVGVYGNGVTPKYTMNITYLRNGTAGPAGSLEFVDSDRPDDILITRMSSGTYSQQLAFKRELTAKPTDSYILKARFRFGTATEEFWNTWEIPVTQNSNLKFPEFTEVQAQTVNIGDAGGIVFKTILDGNDVTANTVLTGIEANDYVDFQNGKWRVYNARSGDTQLTVTMLVDITVDGKTYQARSPVPFTVKAWDRKLSVKDVKTITANVWDLSGELPFTVMMGNSVLEAAKISKIEVTTPNSYVTADLSKGQAWYVVGGDQTKAVVEKAHYKVTYTFPSGDAIVETDVTFNIGQYDGVEFKLLATGDGLTDNALFISSGAGNNSTLRLVAVVKGIQSGVSITHNAWALGPGLTNGNIYASAGAVVIYQMRGKVPGSTNLKSFIDVTAILTGTAGDKPGVNKTTLRTPVNLAANPSYVAVEGPTPVTGKLGEEPSTEVFMMSYGGRINFNESSVKLSFTPADVIEYVPGSGTTKGFKVRFLKSLYDDTTTTVKVNVIAATPPLYGGDFDLVVNQKLDKEAIRASAADVTVKMGENGNIRVVGSYGTGTLADNVILNKAKSDGKGLVELGVAVPDGDDLLIPIESLRTGIEQVVIQLVPKSSPDGGPVPDKDYLDLTSTVTITPDQLTIIDGFEKVGSGTRWKDVSLQQGVKFGDNPISNLTDGLTISVDTTAPVTIVGVEADKIIYRFNEETETTLNHSVVVTFTYTGLPPLTETLTLTQNPSDKTPIIRDLGPMDIEFGKTYGTPFKVISPRE